MTDLTAKQRQQRCDWAREMWNASENSSEWGTTLAAVHTLLGEAESSYSGDNFIALFKSPEDHPDLLDALFEEYMRRKLIGEAP